MAISHVTHVDAVFGQIVVAERLRKGWGQVELAQKLGLHAPALSRLERGESPINIAMITNIARVLGISPTILFEKFDAALLALERENIELLGKKEIPKDNSGIALALLGAAALAFLISR